MPTRSKSRTPSGGSGTPQSQLQGSIHRRNTIGWLPLAEADDYLTTVLIDHLFFWIETRKVNKGFKVPTDVSPKLILQMLRTYIIDAKTPDTKGFISKFLELEPTKILLNHLRDEFTIQEFKKHLKGYLDIYSPKCGFEISTSDRYQVRTKTSEACIVARKQFEPDEMVEFLTGTFARLTKEEEEMLGGSDFSVIQLSDHKSKFDTSHLMLGPTRFLNHDCKPNAEFRKVGGRAALKTIKTILPGEEITVLYANGYFGKNNKECLCATCERTKKGWFDPNRTKGSTGDHVTDAGSEDEVADSKKGAKSRNREKKEGGTEDDDEEDDEKDEVILIASDSEGEDSNDLLSNTPTPPCELTSIETPTLTPTPISTPTLSSSLSVRQHQPTILANLKTSLADSQIAEPTGIDVGGRKLRRRDIERSYKRIEVDFSIPKQSILHLCPKDDSIDSLSLDHYISKEEKKQRRTNKRLHRLYNPPLYAPDADKKMIYDCKNCGLYFKLSSKHIYKEYCPRCARHQLIYQQAWPDIIKRDYSNPGVQIRRLRLDREVSRMCIYDVEKLQEQMPLSSDYRSGNFDLLYSDSDADFDMDSDNESTIWLPEIDIQTRLKDSSALNLRLAEIVNRRIMKNLDASKDSVNEDGEAADVDKLGEVNEVESKQVEQVQQAEGNDKDHEASKVDKVAEVVQQVEQIDLKERDDDSDVSTSDSSIESISNVILDSESRIKLNDNQSTKIETIIARTSVKRKRSKSNSSSKSAPTLSLDSGDKKKETSSSTDLNDNFSGELKELKEVDEVEEVMTPQSASAPKSSPTPSPTPTFKGLFQQTVSIFKKKIIGEQSFFYLSGNLPETVDIGKDYTDENEEKGKDKNDKDNDMNHDDDQNSSIKKNKSNRGRKRWGNNSNTSRSENRNKRKRNNNNINAIEDNNDNDNNNGNNTNNKENKLKEVKARITKSSVFNKESLIGLIFQSKLDAELDSDYSIGSSIFEDELESDEFPDDDTLLAKIPATNGDSNNYQYLLDDDENGCDDDIFDLADLGKDLTLKLL